MPKVSKNDQLKMLRDDIREVRHDTVHLGIIMDNIERHLKVIKTDLADLASKKNE